MPEILKALKDDSSVTSLVLQGEKYIVVNTGGSLRLKKVGSSPLAMAALHPDRGGAFQHLD